MSYLVSPVTRRPLSEALFVANGEALIEGHSRCDTNDAPITIAAPLNASDDACIVVENIGDDVNDVEVVFGEASLGTLSNHEVGCWVRDSGSWRRVVPLRAFDVTEPRQPDNSRGCVLGTGDIPSGGTPVVIPGNANEALTSDGAGGVLAASNVKAGAGFISVATVPTAPAAAGILRIDYSGGARVVVAVRNSIDSADWAVLTLTGSTSTFGIDGGIGQLRGDRVDVNGGASGVIVNASGVQVQRHTSANSFQSLPRLGDSTVYASDGEVTIATDGNVSLGAAQYSRRIVRRTGMTAPRTDTWPHPASQDASYEKIIVNTTASVLTVGTGTGATADVPATSGRIVRFSPSGAELAQF